MHGNIIIRITSFCTSIKSTSNYTSSPSENTSTAPNIYLEYKMKFSYTKQIKRVSVTAHFLFFFFLFSK